MSSIDVSQGWYSRRPSDTSGPSSGPYSWADLSLFAHQGTLSPDDLVWHEAWPQWTPAARVPGLFAQTPQPQVAQPAAPAWQQPAQPQRPAARGRKGLALLVGAVAVLVLGVVLAGVWLLSGLGAGGPSLGRASTKLPDSSALVSTTEWGQVPANQIAITLAEGGGRADADKVAEALGGSVVGEVEFIDAYQIEFPGTSEADLAAALAKAQTDPKVALAFPNQQDRLDSEIWGVRQDPFTDPIYGGGAGDGYSAIGVGKAWSYIKGSGIDLNNVKVGICDDGIYKSGEGRESEFGGDVDVEFEDPDADELTTPEVWDDGTTNPAGSHGTGVATIIAGDAANGGPSGIAAPLGNKLKISVLNKYAGQYGTNSTATADPADTTKATIGGQTYSFGSLVALKKQVESNAKVINCSFGKTNGSPEVAAAFKKFFEKMAAEHPDVLFVCSAGNDGEDVDGTRRFPSGHALPNMITVGALDNDGRTATYSNRATGTYEVTLGAPGTQAVVGTKADGGPERQDGTSFAAPHVTAAAALLKSINPKLQAADVKRILTETARKELPAPGPGGAARLISPNVGGCVLAVDEAVFAEINRIRKEQGLSEMSREDMENAGVVDAVAITGEPGEYTVKGIIKAAGKSGTNLAISVSGDGHAVGGKTSQGVSGSGETQWSVSLPKSEGVITVTRDDNGAASVITIQGGVLDGTWEFPETVSIMGGEPQETGATITMQFVRDGDGYALTGSWSDAKVTLDGQKVRIVHTYEPLLDLAGGETVWTGTVDGDTIEGTMSDTFNGTMPWRAVRVK